MVHEILSNEQMAEADRRTIESGTPGFTLMQKAGRAVADLIQERYKNFSVLILCGPGNNGGNGFVIAALLKESGADVTCACLTEKGKLKGDAFKAAELWNDEILSFKNLAIASYDLIVDAVFGTGFRGDLPEQVASLFQNIKTCAKKVLAVDIPSGVNGNTGEVSPHALKAQITVTFHRKKIGHVLYPGRGYCGEVLVRDIGIDQEFEHTAIENTPDLWAAQIPAYAPDAHKYSRGHALIYGAPELTGATRLAAEAAGCARAGAGLVTVLAPAGTGEIYRTTLPAHILVRDDLDWDDERVTAKLYGPGGMAQDYEYDRRLPTVLDADALAHLPKTLGESFILTPHEGEFQKAFPDITGSKIERALTAAKQTGALIVLKGADTVIAAPDGRCVVNTNAPASLATAGSGDVLAGLITGLLAQKMESFAAACAAVWIHGRAAEKFGLGLVAGDLPDLIPDVLQEVLGFSK